MLHAPWFTMNRFAKQIEICKETRELIDSSNDKNSNDEIISFLDILSQELNICTISSLNWNICTAIIEPNGKMFFVFIFFGYGLSIISNFTDFASICILKIDQFWQIWWFIIRNEIGEHASIFKDFVRRITEKWHFGSKLDESDWLLPAFDYHHSHGEHSTMCTNWYCNTITDCRCWIGIFTAKFTIMCTFWLQIFMWVLWLMR